MCFDEKRLEHLATIVRISKEVVNILGDFEPFIANLPIDDVGLQGLLHECMVHCEGLSFLDSLDSDKFAQSNYEFLDIMQTIILRLLGHSENSISEQQEKLRSILNRINVLLDDLNSPPFILSKKLSDEFLQRKKSDDKLTEPHGPTYTLLSSYS